MTCLDFNSRSRQVKTGPTKLESSREYHAASGHFEKVEKLWMECDPSNDVRPGFTIDTSLQPLLNLVSSYEFGEADGLVILESATWPEDDVILRLIIRRQDQADQHWELHCHDVPDSRIRNHSGIDRINLETEHPLLWPYMRLLADLHFHGYPSDTSTLIGQLVEAHVEAVGKWFDFMHFLNATSERSLRTLFQGGFGELAKGPLPLIEAYANVLWQAGIKASFPPARLPAQWNGQTWIHEIRPMAVIILGESYFVAQKITARLL